MAAGAEGQTRVKDQLDPVGVVRLPRGNDGQTLADVHRVVVFAPAVLPVFLLHAFGLDGVRDAGGLHPGGKESQRLDGRGTRLEVQMDDDGIPGLVQQLVLDEIHMVDLGDLLLDVAVIFDVDAAFGDHGGNGLGVVGIGLGDGEANISPFHLENPPSILRFSLIV